MESGNEYLLQVKGNQPKLLNAVKQTISTSTIVDSDCSIEKNRGRTEQRDVYVYSPLDNPIFKEWLGIKKVIHVVSKGIRNKKAYLENRYYIASTDTQDAKIYNKKIREHWGIENRLHWVKDKTLNEDKSLVRDLDRSENMSIIRNMVINLYRMSGYNNVKYGIEAYTNRLLECIELIYKNFVFD